MESLINKYTNKYISFCIIISTIQCIGGKYQWWSLETWSRSRDVSGDPIFGVSVSKVSGLVSVSKDFDLGLELFVSRLCIGYFLWNFARRSSFKIRFQKMIVQNLAIQWGQWLSFLCCYVVCEMEKTICPLPRLTFILNSIKNVQTPMKPQRIGLISATKGWEYFAKDYLWTVFPRVLLWNP